MVPAELPGSFNEAEEGSWYSHDDRVCTDGCRKGIGDSSVDMSTV